MDGAIVSPGKFEATPVYAPHFWDLYLDGGGDNEFNEDGEYITWFDVEKPDTQEFPELAPYVRVGIWSDDNGFVYCTHVERKVAPPPADHGADTP